MEILSLMAKEVASETEKECIYRRAVSVTKHVAENNRERVHLQRAVLVKKQIEFNRNDI